MDKDKLEELLEARKFADQELEKMRTAVTILFTDIKGSTSYFERKGDVEGLAMVQHHNNLLFPCIERDGGRVVKTIGDAIMACFEDPVGAVKAAIRMQQTLEKDRVNKSGDEKIHIRVGLHTGLGLLPRRESRTRPSPIKFSSPTLCWMPLPRPAPRSREWDGRI
jgi:class 3 adenylate cyclase